MIVFSLLPDGAFVCGDTESRLTSYAYPTSQHANAAKRKGESVACEMMRMERAFFRQTASVRQYDARNWNRMADATPSAIAASGLREIANMVEG